MGLHFIALNWAKKIRSPKWRSISHETLDSDSRKWDSQTCHRMRRASGTPFRGPFSFALLLLYLCLICSAESFRPRQERGVQFVKLRRDEISKFRFIARVEGEIDRLVRSCDRRNRATRLALPSGNRRLTPGAHVSCREYSQESRVRIGFQQVRISRRSFRRAFSASVSKRISKRKPSTSPGLGCRTNRFDHQLGHSASHRNQL